MKYLIMWLVTVVTSFCMEFINEARIFKDLADCGYKLDLKKYSEIAKRINPDGSQKTTLSLLIPIFNIMQVLKNTINYNETRPMILDQFRAMGVLEEMQAYEKREYIKKPTILNAMLITFMGDIRKKNAIRLNIDVDGELGEIVFDFDKTSDDIIIFESSGVASRMTEKEQKDKIKENFIKFFTVINEDFGSVDKFTSELLSNSCVESKDKETVVKLDLSKQDATKEESKKEEIINSFEEQKQALQSLKDELLENDKQEDNKSDNDKTYLKK